MFHCLRGQTRAIPVKIHCQSYAGGAGAAFQSVQTRLNQVSMHMSPFATYHQQYLTLSLPYHIFLLPYHTFLLVYHKKIGVIQPEIHDIA